MEENSAKVGKCIFESTGKKCNLSHENYVGGPASTCESRPSTLRS